jgi:hypothetical protein
MSQSPARRRQAEISVEGADPVVASHFLEQMGAFDRSPHVWRADSLESNIWSFLVARISSLEDDLAQGVQRLYAC